MTKLTQDKSPVCDQFSTLVWFLSNNILLNKNIQLLLNKHKNLNTNSHKQTNALMSDAVNVQELNQKSHWDATILALH